MTVLQFCFKVETHLKTKFVYFNPAYRNDNNTYYIQKKKDLFVLNE